MPIKTISKEFFKIDDKNYQVKEIRESVSDINVDVLVNEMKAFKNNIKQRMASRIKEEEIINWAIKTYNEAIEDIKKLNNEFWYSIEVPEEISFESIIQEVNAEQKTAS